jgi:hypothetical protein
MPGVLAQALRPDATERFLRFAGSERLAGAEHPDAAFFLEGCGAAPGPQDDLVALDCKVEGVTRGEVQFVPEGLGKDHTARSIEGHSIIHTPIL